ncbi:MAG: hypothetical protein HY741_23645 [Chloroflexi bacterium]|nr:hypothetical protein [Chloroflexota bacterium]
MKTNFVFERLKILFGLCRVFGLAMLLGFAHRVDAATINIGCDANELVNAINTANANPDADTLELATSCVYNLTVVDNTDAANGPNGLPVITSDITVNGNGSTITRASSAPAFRLVQIDSSATLTLNQLTLTAGDPGMGAGGSGWDGGAIRNRGVLALNYSAITSNNAGNGGNDNGSYGNGGHGGGIYNVGMLTVTASDFSSNTTANGVGSRVGGDVGDGGGIYNLGTLTITASNLSGNKTGDGAGQYGSSGGGNGGAIYNAGELTITSSTLTNNATGDTCNGSGGAIYNANAGELNLSSSQLTDNRTGVGGYSYGSTTLRNNIIANSTAGGNCSGALADDGGNLRWPDTDTSCVGAFGDPKLGTLQDNGGLTRTMALGADSAALERGVAANCPATDQRGQTRPDPSGTICDSGAYESELRPVIENTDFRVLYNGWLGEANTNVSGTTYRVSSIKNDKVTFKFTGASVAWIARKGPDMGKAKVTIDGVDKGIVDLYRATEQWQFKKNYKNLTNAKHTLVITVTGTKNAQSSARTVGVDGFKMGSTVTEDTALNVQYNNWSGKTNVAASGGSYHASKKKNATARLTFTGTQIKWLTAKGPGYGKADVYVDGVRQGTFDLYASSAQWKVEIGFTGLSAAQHTIEVRVFGEKNAASSGTMVIVDGFQGATTVP